MSHQSALKPAATASQEADGDTKVALQPFKVGDILPRRMSALDMMRAFPVNGHPMRKSAFYAHEAAGRFERFELRPQIGAKAWSGTLVARYLDCEGGASRFVTAGGGMKKVG